MQQRSRCCHLDGVKVTIRLRGWKGEVRLLTVHEACWMVDIIIQGKGLNVSTNQHTGKSYLDALGYYNRLREALNV